MAKLLNSLATTLAPLKSKPRDFTMSATAKLYPT